MLKDKQKHTIPGAAVEDPGNIAGGIYEDVINSSVSLERVVYCTRFSSSPQPSYPYNLGLFGKGQVKMSILFQE